MTTLQLNEFGLRYVTQWLARNGYRIDPTHADARRALLAASGPDRVLVAVRAALHPAMPQPPVAAEWYAMKLEAAAAGRKAFTALVTLAPGGPLFREIEWMET